jgi:molybdopterin-guanine dinucleotide biosynthesis protein A
MLREFIDQGGTSFQAWLDTAWVQVLPVENPEVLFNCNTPEDWRILTS